jgi:hypothetical protein
MAAKPGGGLLPARRAAIPKIAHRMTGWETIWPLSSRNGDKGEIPAPFGAYQQVGGQSCAHTAWIPLHAFKGLRALVANLAALRQGSQPCRAGWSKMLARR